jgi:trehalose 6-phosphate synthase/phosphatase
MMPDRIPLHSQGWEAYKRVNRLFADAVASLYRDGDMIWIHDYQLMLVPLLLRERLPYVRIGFFLHIPFPSFELYRTLPWAREILLGVLGSNLIGFHTAPYRDDFYTCVNKLLPKLSNLPDTKSTCTSGRIGDQANNCLEETAANQNRGFGNDAIVLHHRDSDAVAYRDVVLSVFPMGIDTQKFQELASSPDVQREAELIRRSSSARHILLGIDRLDYTKGIPRRLLAFERMLETHKELRNQVVLIQVAVPSRTNLPEYREFTAHLNELVGRINGAYATATHSPIIYMYKSISIRELIALFIAADVMAVTPLRDGMNLVAKEFIASRVDESGALLLSEFAGASFELHDYAFMVNPFDIDGTAQMMVEALRASSNDKQRRIRELRKIVFSQSVHDWSLSFLHRLSQLTPSNSEAILSAPAQNSDLTLLHEQISRFINRGAVSQDEVIDGVARSRHSRLVLLLDYDGTLVPLTDSPSLSTPDAELLDLLGELTQVSEVHIVSGRMRGDLQQWLGHLPVHIWAEHGTVVHIPSPKVMPISSLRSSRFQARLDASKSPTEPSSDSNTNEEPSTFWSPTVSASEIESWKPAMVQFLQSLCREYEGSFFEVKEHSLAFHFRLVTDTSFEPEAVYQRLKAFCDQIMQVDLLRGNMVFEVRAKYVSKGALVPWLISECEINPYGIVAFGDDVTDEELFSALPSESLSIHVLSGNPDWLDKASPVRKTCANLVLTDFRAVRSILKDIAGLLRNK